jgi:hypothetical protein
LQPPAPQPCQQITKIQVDRSSGRKGNQRRTESSLNANNSKLLREMFRFIGTCSALHTVCFCSVDIPLKIMPQLGKALVGSTSGQCVVCVSGLSALCALCFLLCCVS